MLLLLRQIFKEQKWQGILIVFLVPPKAINLGSCHDNTDWTHLGQEHLTEPWAAKACQFKVLLELLKKLNKLCM